MDTHTLVCTVLRTSGQEIPSKFTYLIITGTRQKTKTYTSLLFYQDSKLASKSLEPKTQPQ